MGVPFPGSKGNHKDTCLFASGIPVFDPHTHTNFRLSGSLQALDGWGGALAATQSLVQARLRVDTGILAVPLRETRKDYLDSQVAAFVSHCCWFLG